MKIKEPLFFFLGLICVCVFIVLVFFQDKYEDMFCYTVIALLAIYNFLIAFGILS